MKTPEISVLMPAYNAEKHIEEAVKSILNQTFKDFELIIIDDNSTDNTWQIIQKFKSDKRVKLFRNEKNIKLSKTLNKAITLAKGRYLARMDADDISYPERLELQFNFMEKHPAVGIVGGTMDIISEDCQFIAKRMYHQTDNEIRKHIFRYSPYSHPLIMIRAAVLQQSGVYDNIYNPAEDYELYFRIGMYSKFANLKNTLLKYRIVNNSMTTGDTKRMELKTLEIRYKFQTMGPYKMNFLDHIYTKMHYVLIFLLPSSFRIWLFNQFRNSYL